jgi:hypothetical protein
MRRSPALSRQRGRALFAAIFCAVVMRAEEAVVLDWQDRIGRSVLRPRQTCERALWARVPGSSMPAGESCLLMCSKLTAGP